MAFAMGGRAAEELYYDGVVSTGAHNDLEKATETARAMVTVLGMSDDIGPISLGTPEQQSMFGGGAKMSQKTAEMVDGEIRRLLEEAHDKALAILTEKRALLEELSALLIAIETIEGDDLIAYANGTKPIPEPEAAQRALDEQSAAAAAEAKERRSEAPVTRHTPSPA